MGIIFAVCSMFFAGLTDFFFKKYTDHLQTSLGCFFAGIGLVWATVFAIPLLIQGQANWHGWPIALAAGLTSILANILLVTALFRLDAGVGSTVYRLNLVLVPILAAIFLTEPVNAAKMIAISLGVGAVLLVYQPVGDPLATLTGRNRFATALPFILLVTAASIRAVMGLLFKVGANHGVGQYEFLVVTGSCWFAGGILYGLVSRGRLLPSLRDSRYAITTGLVICGNVLFLALAVKYGEASVVVPISQLSFTITILLARVVLHERLTVKRVCALASAVLCIVFMSQA